MFNYIANAVKVNNSANTLAISGTGGNSTAVDISNAEGPILIAVWTASGGTATMTITPKQSTVSGSGFTAIAAANLLDPDTGAQATFRTVSTAGDFQVLAVQRVNSQQFIRVDLSGTGLTQTVTVAIIFSQKYTS